MKTCCACGFKLQANKINNISFHKFPRDENLRNAWCDAVGPNFSPRKTSVLCSKHFLENCFFYPPGGTKQRRHIKHGSLPTIFGFRMTKKYRNLQESFNITDEEISAATDLKHHLGQLIQAVPSDAMGAKQIEPVHLVHNIKVGEATNKEDNLNACPETPQRKKTRKYNPRFVGDCDFNDFKSREKSTRNWKLAMSYIKMQRSKIKIIQQQNRRLRTQVTDLKSLFSKFIKEFNIKRC